MLKPANSKLLYISLAHILSISVAPEPRTASVLLRFVSFNISKKGCYGNFGAFFQVFLNFVKFQNHEKIDLVMTEMIIDLLKMTATMQYILDFIISEILSGVEACQLKVAIYFSGPYPFH